jgi:hypothetical protein
MSKRPPAVTFIACVFIAAGVFGAVIHSRELVSERLFRWEDLWAPLLSLVAAVAGIFILLGHNWARWLAVAWMAFHVAISFFDSVSKIIVHAVLLALIAYALFRRDSSTYFQQPNQLGM